MARETVFLVQGFTASQGRLKADAPSRFKNEEAARRAVQKLGETRVGAVAFSTSGDPELGDYDDEPIILVVVGRVPEHFSQ